MRFRLGLISGFATGYYLGARAGRQRYEQINQSLRRMRRSDALEAAAEKARSVVENRVDNGQPEPVPTLPGMPPLEDEDYSSSR